jgi:hypothetical protein
MTVYLFSIRLLNVNSNGNFCSANFIGSQIPNYAILSQTWETNEQAVTLHDLKELAEQDPTCYRNVKHQAG